RSAGVAAGHERAASPGVQGGRGSTRTGDADDVDPLAPPDRPGGASGREPGAQIRGGAGHARGDAVSARSISHSSAALVPASRFAWRSPADVKRRTSVP